MSIKMMLAISIVTTFVVGCATKQYPITTKLSPAEASLMTCQDLELELLRAEQVERKINATGEFDGKTVLGFLGDFGIGNAMAKSEAQAALSERRKTIREAQVRKDCLKAADREQDEPLNQ